MPDLAIKVEGLSKRYRIGQYIGGAYQYRTLRDIFTDAIHAPFRRLRARSKRRAVDSNPIADSHELPAMNHEPSAKFIWALRDVSFEVKQGEVVGIIGRNGAGKSTLLKLLSRITEPTQGRAEIKGRMRSLLEVGTGFHSELTGRENTYLSGAILGMTKKEIDQKFDEIVDFSGIEKFIDTPVKRYSSGMLVRLGFAVAAHLEPEILLIDEVLAVGDAVFQKKCLGKMGDVAKEGRTVLFISHNMVAVQTLCSRAIRLDKGYLMEDGEANKVVVAYLKSGASELLEQRWDDPQTAPGNENAKVLYAGISTGPGYNRSYLTVATPLDFVFRIWNLRSEDWLYFNLFIHTQENICVFHTTSSKMSFNEGIIEGVCHIPPNLLNDNIYAAQLMVHYPRFDGINVNNILTFEIHDCERGDDVGWHGKIPGVIRVNLQWELRKIDNQCL